MITVIVPFSRPQCARSVLDNFERQSTARRLLVVENGDAVGTFPTAPGVTVIRSERAHHKARNAGLAWLRVNGGGPWAMFDDDDYYSPGYLSDVCACLDGGADVVGKTWGFVEFPDGLWLFDCADSPTFTGGTLACRSGDCADFQNSVSDDALWSADMRARGARMRASGPWQYVYDRSNDARRVYRATPLMTRRGFGGDALALGKLPKRFVDEPRDLPPGRVFPQPTDTEILTEMLSRK